VVNQRGQAFSVFELMIAGVVAFAILIVLLMVIGGVNPLGTSQDAKTTISNGIKSISPSGDTTTGVFELNSKSALTSDDLTEKTGLDARSIVFAVGQFGVGSNPNTQVVAADSGSGVQYTGSGTLRAKARVICKQTGAKLQAFLDDFVPTTAYAREVNPTDSGACGEEEYMPCCIVLLERPTK
jgi:hypothetical protein